MVINRIQITESLFTSCQPAKGAGDECILPCLFFYQDTDKDLCCVIAYQPPPTREARGIITLLPLPTEEPSLFPSYTCAPLLITWQITTPIFMNLVNTAQKLLFILPFVIYLSIIH